MPSQTFTTESGWQKFNVPKGVERITVDIKGAGSGSARGGRVQGQLKVKDTDVLYLLVGQQGQAASGTSGGGKANGGGGHGGNGHTGGFGGGTGGRGGGGASAIRLNSADGTIKVVAGGAGGASGDGGIGGDGGGTTGAHGNLSGATTRAGNATGGSQTQPGKGGTSGIDHDLDGKDADGGALADGGRGGQTTVYSSSGGGGGGGGYRAGGGGVGSLLALTGHPGGGGGGGSSFTSGLSSVLATQGGGTTSNGSIILTWVGPPPANQPPTTPSDIKINGKAESSGMATKSTGRVTVSAIVRDPDSTTVDPTHTGGPSTQRHEKARLLVRYAPNSKFHNARTERSKLVKYGERAEVTLTGLSHNTHYYLRVFTEDAHGRQSLNYNAANFWTNRDPNPPSLQSPSDNTTILTTDTITFDWSHQDPDGNDKQSGFEIRWRKAQDGDRPAGRWRTVINRNTSFDNYSASPGAFNPGYYYDWTVRTKDQQNAWGPFAEPRSFFVLGTTAPPTLLSPRHSVGVDATVAQTLSWKFRDPETAESQVKADYRFRVKGTDPWVTVLGDTTTPGNSQTWEVSENTFVPGLHYEWSMRTYNTADPLPSDWSDPADFWAHGGLGSAAVGASLVITDDAGELGCGTHRVFIYDRGGRVRRGEITPLESVNWYRKRDDLGGAVVTTNGFGSDCGELLRNLHTWIHELVIYRDGERVMEGPVTLIEDSRDGFKIECKDVMGYVYRRIMRQGYNDSFHVVQGVEEGLLTVVERAGLILSSALARGDPNVLPYVTLLTYPDDARQSRVVPDFAKTAWEEIDDMAANAGLDYSVIGRRIILNDTHRPVGRLAEWRTDYFDDAPVISEYGMLLADYYAVTNNAGLWGAVEHADSPYGGVELLVSSFNENGAGDAEAMTRAQQEAVRRVLVEQARRGIANRYPAPYIVRVPDNSQLLPHVPVGINQLVPGVWVPLRAEGTAIELSQWQKLDAVNVTEERGNEQVQVTLSAAPHNGEDPDAGNVTDEALS